MIKCVYLKILKLSYSQHLMKGVQVVFLRTKLLHIKKIFYYKMIRLPPRWNRSTTTFLHCIKKIVTQKRVCFFYEILPFTLINVRNRFNLTYFNHTKDLIIYAKNCIDFNRWIKWKTINTNYTSTMTPHFFTKYVN